MTLFETLVALVILGLTAVGFLQAFQTTTRASHSAGTWVQAVSYAEAAMEQTKLGPDALQGAASDSLPKGFTRSIEVRPWTFARNIDRVTVTITLPDGGAFVLERLVATQ